MAEQAPASEFAGALLTTLVEHGVRHVVLAPGARSQALALVAAELEARGDIQLHVRIDERVAGFVALGIGVESKAPAVVITTSGSAVVNLHPAVIEAHHAGVPLIVLTADRPEELRGIGSNQTTTQLDIFGTSVRLSVDEPAPEFGEVAKRAKQLANAAWDAAMDLHAPGPVHLNLAFREPLSGPTELPGVSTSSTREVSGTPATVLELSRGPRTVVIAGADAGPVAEEIAHQGGWPLIAEISSGARYGRNLVASYREALSIPEYRNSIERVVVFGHPTLSREIPALLGDTSTGIETIVVRGTSPEGYNPGHNVTAFVDEVTVVDGDIDRQWLGSWMRLSQELSEKVTTTAFGDNPALVSPDVEAARSASPEAQKEFLKKELAAARAPITRELLVDAVWRATWPHDRLVFGASRLIRVADKILGGKKVSVHANRGLAGIDGTISTATGIALASAPALTRVVLGDLAALHDAGGLFQSSGENTPRMQVIIGNDHGGTIFDSLEVSGSAPAGTFDRVFLTPHEVNFSALAEAYGWSYVQATTASELERALTGAGSGLELIEVVLER